MSEEHPLRLDDLLSEGKLDFQWLARSLVHGLQFGQHRSSVRGHGHEFLSRREYQPGDALKFVDWKYWARSDQWFVKEFHRETNRSAYFFLDRSASMNFGSGSHNKWLYARALTACLIATLEAARDAVSLHSFQKISHPGDWDHQPDPDFSPELIQTALESAGIPSARPDHYDSIYLALQHAPVEKELHPESAVEDPLEVTRPRGLTVLITDAFMPQEILMKWCADLKSMDHEVAVFHVLTPEEWEPPKDGEFTLRENESGSEMEIEWSQIRKEYLKNRDSAIALLEDGFRNEEVDYCRVLTNEPLNTVLQRFFELREVI